MFFAASCFSEVEMVNSVLSAVSSKLADRSLGVGGPAAQNMSEDTCSVPISISLGCD